MLTVLTLEPMPFGLTCVKNLNILDSGFMSKTHLPLQNMNYVGYEFIQFLFKVELYALLNDVIFWASLNNNCLQVICVKDN